MSKLIFVVVSILVLIGCIALLGFLNAPGWFVDIAILGEGVLLILNLRGSRRRSPNF